MEYYSNRFLLSPNDYVTGEWWKNTKKELNQVEKIGLENVLQDFIKEYELETMGESHTNIIDYTRWNTDSIDILDGYHDTYIFDNCAIGDIKMTDNGIIILNCVDLNNYAGDDIETYIEHKDDYFELIDHCDLFADFEPVSFRLN